MKPRTCFIWVWIANDAGAPCRYSLRPVAAADLGQSAAAFRLANLSRDPSPVYVVRLSVDGLTSCDCPQHASAGHCKHADALTAAGVLPTGLLGLLRFRTELLDMAEKMLKDTEDKLDAVSARAAQLQTALASIPPARPKRSRRRVAEAKAA